MKHQEERLAANDYPLGEKRRSNDGMILTQSAFVLRAATHSSGAGDFELPTDIESVARTGNARVHDFTSKTIDPAKAKRCSEADSGKLYRKFRGRPSSNDYVAYGTAIDFESDAVGHRRPLNTKKRLGCNCGDSLQTGQNVMSEETLPRAA